jgi:hypothetical protein
MSACSSAARLFASKASSRSPGNEPPRRTGLRCVTTRLRRTSGLTPSSDIDAKGFPPYLKAGARRLEGLRRQPHQRRTEVEQSRDDLGSVLDARLHPETSRAFVARGRPCTPMAYAPTTMNRASAASNDRNRPRKSGFMPLAGVGDLVELLAELPRHARRLAHGNCVPEQDIVLFGLFPRVKDARAQFLRAWRRAAASTRQG